VIHVLVESASFFGGDIHPMANPERTSGLDLFQLDTM
jgi:hypothetical protein